MKLDRITSITQALMYAAFVSEDRLTELPGRESEAGKKSGKTEEGQT